MRQATTIPTDQGPASRGGALRKLNELRRISLRTLARASLGGRGLDRLRAIVMRVGLTGADQCVASLSNFGVGVAVARVAGIAAFGAYSLAYVAWLAMAGIHRALVAEPMAIDNDVRREDARASVRLGLAGELALGAGLGGLVLLIGVLLLALRQHAYGVGFVAVAPWVPCLLIQDYWRWVAFMKAAPGKALANDLLFDGVQAVAFLLLFVLGLRSSVLAIGTWGLGALAGSIFGLWQHSVTPLARGGIARMRQRWTISRGLLGVSVTNWGASQIYVVLTGAMLGPAGLGGLRAAQSLVSGPTFVFLQAGGMIGLPEASRGLHERGWKGMQTVGRAVTGAGVLSIVLVGLVVLVFGRNLLILLYGSQFGRFESTADILVLSVLIATMSLGAILALKTTKLTGLLFGCSMLSLVVSAVAVVVLVPLFGLDGAAFAAVARNSTSSMTQIVLHRRRSRRAAEVLLASRGAPSGRDLVAVGSSNGSTNGSANGSANSATNGSTNGSTNGPTNGSVNGALPVTTDERHSSDGEGATTTAPPVPAIVGELDLPSLEARPGSHGARLVSPNERDPSVQWWRA